MNTASTLPQTTASPLGLPKSAGVWRQAWNRLTQDRVGMISLGVVSIFAALVLLAQMGWIAGSWQAEVATPFAPPDFVGKIVDGSQTAVVDTVAGANVDLSDVDPLAPRYAEWAARAAKVTDTRQVKADTRPLGADQLGRDVLLKTIKGAQVSISVGVAAALLATFIGTLLGAVAGYFGGKADDALEWLYSVFTAIPYILLVFSLAAVLKSGPLARLLGNGIWNVIIILSLVGWTSIYRLVRAEYIKHRSRDYVRAAEAIGASHAARMFGHILPNISHVVLVQLSLSVVAFIKTEVILSFLGLGVPLDMVSWGTMLAESQIELLLGKWWQLTAATVCMATFVTAFALLTDALRDALDPKLR